MYVYGRLDLLDRNCTLSGICYIVQLRQLRLETMFVVLFCACQMQAALIIKGFPILYTGDREWEAIEDIKFDSGIEPDDYGWCICVASRSYEPVEMEDYGIYLTKEDFIADLESLDGSPVDDELSQKIRTTLEDPTGLVITKNLELRLRKVFPAGEWVIPALGDRSNVYTDTYDVDRRYELTHLV